MSIENIDQLINSLQLIRKQLLENKVIHPLDKDLLKNSILNFYENTFHRDSNMDKPIQNSHSSLIEKVDSTMNEEVKQPIHNFEVIEENIIKKVEEKIQTPIIDHTKIDIPVMEKPKEIVLESVKDVTNVIQEPIHFEPSIKANISTDNNESNSSTGTGLNERFSNASSSINERFQSTTSLADKFSTQRKSMNELIDLNKRLLFVDVLFNGNSQLFTQVVQHIDEYKSANEAIKFVEFNKEKLQINEKKESVYLSFLEIIHKKFS